MEDTTLVLLELYKVAHAEKLFTSRAVMERAGFFVALNAGLLSFLGANWNGLPLSLELGGFAVLALVDTVWFFINERNRSYTRYCVDHLARLESLLIPGQEGTVSPRLFFNMNDFTRGMTLTLFPKEENRDQTRISCAGRVVRIERAYSFLAIGFALLNLFMFISRIFAS